MTVLYKSESSIESESNKVSEEALLFSVAGNEVSFSCFSLCVST